MSEAYPTPEMLAGAKALAAHRCMKDRSGFAGRRWDDYTDVEKLEVLADAEVVISALGFLSDRAKT